MPKTQLQERLKMKCDHLPKNGEILKINGARYKVIGECTGTCQINLAKHRRHTIHIVSLYNLDHNYMLHQQGFCEQCLTGPINFESISLRCKECSGH